MFGCEYQFYLGTAFRNFFQTYFTTKTSYEQSGYLFKHSIIYMEILIILVKKHVKIKINKDKQRAEKNLNRPSR